MNALCKRCVRVTWSRLFSPGSKTRYRKFHDENDVSLRSVHRSCHRASLDKNGMELWFQGESYVLSVTSKVYHLYCNVTSEILIVENLFREAAYQLG